MQPESLLAVLIFSSLITSSIAFAIGIAVGRAN